MTTEVEVLVKEKRLFGKAKIKRRKVSFYFGRYATWALITEGIESGRQIDFGNNDTIDSLLYHAHYNYQLLQFRMGHKVDFCMSRDEMKILRRHMSQEDLQRLFDQFMLSKEGGEGLLEKVAEVYGKSDEKKKSQKRSTKKGTR